MSVAEATQTIWFSDWTDSRIRSRMAVLQLIKDGNPEAINAPEWMTTSLFPQGYDPENHPGENYHAVRAEFERRGLS